MRRIIHDGQEFDCRPGETVLDALLRHGQRIPFSCRNGSCLVCLRRCVRGNPGERSQRALRSSLQRAGYFLPCRCTPAEDLEIEAPRAADLFSPAVVQAKERLAPDVFRVLLEPATSLYYHAGQFVNVRREDGLTRSYSLASLPTEDELLEIHVKRMNGGAMSGWICDQLAVGDVVEIQGPNGRCYYVPGTQAQDLLLVGNGTGVAPLVGIVRDALHVGHRGRILLFHGSRAVEGLYLHDRLRRLSDAHPNFEYIPCVSGDTVAGFAHGRANDVARARCVDLAGWRVFAAGLPQLVAEVEAFALAAGANPTEIHSDPYTVRDLWDTAPAESPAPAITPDRMPVAEGTGGKADSEWRPAPDPELWEALGRGELLNAILTDFYTRVFEDPILSPYFRGITRERVIGQVFSFMRDLVTGARHYFGLRPRTAHHWMVISDEIFDYRERLMEASLRRHGLSDPLIERWRRIEERYRADIVKDSPWKLVVDGIEMPLDGFGEVELSAGAICDGCQRVIEVGERVRYHLRLGLTYCPGCTATSASVGAP